MQSIWLCVLKRGVADVELVKEIVKEAGIIMPDIDKIADRRCYTKKILGTFIARLDKKKNITQEYM